MSTDAQLMTIMNNNLPTNGNGDIDAAEHRNVVGALISSKVSREDDATKLNLRNLDPLRAYEVGEGFIFNGAIYQSVFGHDIGENPTSPGSATFQRLTQVPVVETFAPWDDATTYEEGDTIRRNYRLYESLVDDNLDNDPSLEDPLVNWVEVSAAEDVWGVVYTTETVYEKRQVVFNESTGYFYWANIATDNFTSTNFATEAAAGIWQIFVSSSSIEKIYEENVGNIFLTPAYLNANFSSLQLGQKIESTWQVAEKTLDNWLISKKNENELIIVTVDLSDVNIFDIINMELDLSSFAGADVVKINTNYIAYTADGISTADPAIITPSDAQLYQDGQMIQFDGAGTVYSIQNIDYVAGTFELFLADGVTSVDGSTIQGNIGDTMTFEDDIIKLQIEVIVGIPTNFVIIAKTSDSQEYTFNNVPRATVTTNQIVIESGSNLTLTSVNSISDWVEITKIGDINVIGNASTF